MKFPKIISTSKKYFERLLKPLLNGSVSKKQIQNWKKSMGTGLWPLQCHRNRPGTSTHCMDRFLSSSGHEYSGISDGSVLKHRSSALIETDLWSAQLFSEPVLDFLTSNGSMGTVFSTWNWVNNGWIGFENASIWSENASICSQNATRRLVSASGRRIGSRTVSRSCLILFAEWQTTFLGHRSVLDRLTRVWMGFREPIHRDLSGFELRGWIGWQCYHF